MSPAETPAKAIWQEAAIEAALRDGHGCPLRDRAELFTAASAEIMFLLAELENPAPASTAARRVQAIEILAEMMRVDKTA